MPERRGAASGNGPERRRIAGRKFTPGLAAASLDLGLQALAERVNRRRLYYDAREVLRAKAERLDLAPNRALGALFVHIPKCGGTSVENQIGAFHGHRSAVYFRAADPRLFAAAWKFSIVRNPYDRLVSGFHYLKHHTRSERDRAWADAVLGPCPDFAAFAARLAEPGFRDRVLAWLHFQPQWYYLCDAGGRLLVDEVARLEEFAAFAARFNAAGHAVAFDTGVRRRPSDRAAWPTYYDAATAARVAAIYARDFEILGYPTTVG
jgi:Sulfotransferase family